MLVGIILLIIFLGGMILIGIWGWRKTFSLNDFFLGGRTIGPWISAFAYGTTYFSAVLFIGFAGRQGWNFGLNALWIALGNSVFGALLAWLILGPRTRKMSQNLDAMTMPEFLQERYNAKYLKILSSLIIFIFLLPYSASVFKGLGHLFEANFKIPYDIALIIMIGVTGIYLVLGGYFAITLTDFIQGIIMIIGSLILVSVITYKAGGLSNAIHTVINNYNLHIPPDKQPTWYTILSLVFMTSFGTWGLPQMIQKFYAIKNENVIKKAAIVTFIFSIIIVFSAYYTGALTHVFFTNDPTQTNLLQLPKTPDEIIPKLFLHCFSNNIYLEILMAVILLLILSASMSTLSSLVLVSSSAIAIDLYKGHINPNISKENSLIMMRFLSAIFVILSYIIARYKFEVIVVLMSLSWGSVAGSFMAPYIYSIYWKSTSKAGIYAGIISGLITNISLFYILGPSNSPLASSIAMIIPFFVVPIISYFTKKPDSITIDKAFNGI